MPQPYGGKSELLKVNIYDAAATDGTPIQLIGAKTPFSTAGVSDSDFYTPIRSQSGYIRFVCESESIISDIMPLKATDRPITLTNSADTVLWAGFLSGEQYSQPWEPVPYTLQLPVKGLLSSLAGVEFTQSDGFCSLASLIADIGHLLPYTPRIIYPAGIPVDSLFVDNDNFREFLTKKEREDRNTTNVYSADSIRDVIEAFVKYFGLSLHEYHGDIYLIAHDATSYSCTGGSAVSPASHNLQGLGIMSANNKMSFAKFYRYVHGEFDTGSSDDKSKTITELNDFSDYMPVNKSSNQFLIFDAADPVTCHIPNTKDYYVGWTDKDNDYIMPQMLCGVLYRNGNAYYSNGGHVVDYYHNESGQHAVTGARSNGGADLIQITTPVSTNEIKKVFTIKSMKPVKILSGEHSLLNIHMNLKAFGEKYGSNLSVSHFGNGTDYNSYYQEGNIENGAVYISVKVGDMYLKYHSGEGSSLEDFKAEWTTDESYIPCNVDESVPYFEYLRDDDDAKAAVFVEDPGIVISLPESMRNKIVPVEVGLWSGVKNIKKWGGNVTHNGVLTKEDGKDFDANYIDVIITNFKIAVAFEGGTETIGTDLDSNTFIVPNDNASTYKYDVSSKITTRRGLQHGTGLALNSDKTYCTTEYDLEGCKRRADLVAKNREILTVDVSNDTSVAPFDTITWHGMKFSPLSDSINWRDNDNELKLINIS